MVEPMDKPKQESRSMAIALCVGLVLSTAAIVRVGLWRAATPQPAALSPVLLSWLERGGWTVRSRRPTARSGEDLSWATGAELVNPGQYPGAVLNLVPVQARGPTSYTLKTLVKPVVNTTEWKPKLLRFGNHERAQVLPDHVSKQQTGGALQTEAACFSNRVALAKDERLLNNKLEKEELTSLSTQLERLAGVRQTRSWDCLLVVLRQPVKGASNINNNQLWSTVVRTLVKSTGLPR